MRQMSFDDLNIEEVPHKDNTWGEWKDFPEGAQYAVDMKAKMPFPGINTPDWIAKGCIYLDGMPIKAEVAFTEYVSGFNECFHHYEPVKWREV